MLCIEVTSANCLNAACVYHNASEEVIIVAEVVFKSMFPFRAWHTEAYFVTELYEVSLSASLVVANIKVKF